LLGYRISEGVIQHDPGRLRPSKVMPAPQSPKGQVVVLGMFAYYSKWYHV